MHESALRTIELLGTVGGIAPQGLRTDCQLTLDDLLSEALDLRSAAAMLGDATAPD